MHILRADLDDGELLFAEELDWRGRVLAQLGVCGEKYPLLLQHCTTALFRHQSITK